MQIYNIFRYNYLFGSYSNLIHSLPDDDEESVPGAGQPWPGPGGEVATLYTLKLYLPATGQPAAQPAAQLDPGVDK